MTRFLFSTCVFLSLCCFATSAEPEATGPVETAEQAPDFSAIDEEGEEHSLSELHGKYVVLVFTRAHW